MKNFLAILSIPVLLSGCVVYSTPYPTNGYYSPTIVASVPSSTVVVSPTYRYRRPVVVYSNPTTIYRKPYHSDRYNHLRHSPPVSQKRYSKSRHYYKKNNPHHYRRNDYR